VHAIARTCWTQTPSEFFGRIASLAFLLLATTLFGAASAWAQALPPPPNLIPITERLTTSGQPSAAWLETIAARGYEAVIYLAPLTVGDAIPDEPQILARQSIDFVHIPIASNQPTDADFDSFAAAMTRFADKKVLVHCQINMRASSMVFLYRTIVGKEDPQVAFASVEKVWTPNGVWKAFMQAQLQRHGVTFDFF
jgi:protein tyrosine phosphatase (PTP) superfamily phosphohydrolase (DUF442 family)